MPTNQLTIGFVRRGYSASGGAEAYLKRLARGVTAAGHRARLFTTEAWPEDEWKFGEITRVRAEAPRRFADEIAKLEARGGCDVLMSLERVWSCDVYRAGDGVHAAWLERRARFSTRVENFVRSLRFKHDGIVELEQSLFAQRGARRVIVNSKMVQTEIEQFYGFPPQHIALIRNGVPTAPFTEIRRNRDAERAALGLKSHDLAVLFVGSGWERKGLRFAVDAIERCETGARLIVAGRGHETKFRSRRTQFVGVRDATALYAAADIFLLPTLYDPFSNACLEALAAGLPVITTTANGVSEIIADHVHGSVIDDPNDISAIAEALRYWSDAERRQTALSANQQLASAYDIRANVSRTLEIVLQTADSAAST